jgi:hypothetical protein
LNGGKVSLLFSDYDGTLSPLDVTREESRLSPSLDAVLRGIASKAKLAVVTSKSFEFISARIPYAHAWGCIAGLDVRFADGREFAVSPDLDVEAALEKTKAMLDGEASYEEKRGSAGLLGLSGNGRGRPAPAGVAKAGDAMRRDGLYVAREPSEPFVDFLCSPPSKGAAVSHIRNTLGVSGGALFMGDSPIDNPAFREVDIPVGIDHGQPLGPLECAFIVSQRDVAPFLKALYDRDMVFDPALPGLLRK